MASTSGSSASVASGALHAPPDAVRSASPPSTSAASSSVIPLPAAGATSSSTSSPLLHGTPTGTPAAEPTQPLLSAFSGPTSTSSTTSSSSSSSTSNHHFSSSSSEDDESSSGQGSPFVSSRGGASLSSSAPSTTLFVPSASPSSFGASAPVAAALAASMGMGQVSVSMGSSSAAAAAAAAAAYMASPTGHLLSRSMSASKLHMKKKKANVRYKDHCDNCLTDQTPQWRKGRRGETFCQDCGRSERRHDYARLKREREKAIEKTLADLLENSVYVPRWGQAAKPKPAVSAHEREAKVEGPEDGETLQADSDAESVPRQSESRENGKDGHETMEAIEDVTGDRHRDDGDSVRADALGATTTTTSSSSIAGKRKNAEQNNDGEHSQRESEAGGGEVEQVMTMTTTDGGDEASLPSLSSADAAVADSGKGEPEAEGSPATKRRRLPNVPEGHPSPMRLAKRRTLPTGSQAASAVTEANGTGVAMMMMMTHNNAPASEVMAHHHHDYDGNRAEEDAGMDEASKEEENATRASPTAAATEEEAGKRPE